MFVIPYPPGFPVLVPGQVISADTIEYMQALDTREIHGYRPETGYWVFTQAALDPGQETPAAASAPGRPAARSGGRAARYPKALWCSALTLWRACRLPSV
jgi:arginine decarboxylase